MAAARAIVLAAWWGSIALQAAATPRASPPAAPVVPAVRWTEARFGMFQQEVERAMADSSRSWKSLPEISPLVVRAAAVSRFTGHDTLGILAAIKEAAGPDHKTFMLTISDGGMADMLVNMLSSLHALKDTIPPVVVIAIGDGVCDSVRGFDRTSCVEVFKDATSEGQSAWGTQEYYNVILRKHAILLLASVSLDTAGMIYTDPDIVYMKSPVEYLEEFSKEYDMVFSENNCLLVDAEEITDYPAVYEKKGMESTRRGKNKRRADINTGLFHLKRSTAASKLMLKTMEILNDGANGHERAYQQYSMVEALKKVPDVRIGVASGGRLVNGNLYWGHRGLLDPDSIISVHANWMPSELKKTCLKAAGLWYNDRGHSRHEIQVFGGDVVRMDRGRGTILECSQEDTP